MKLKMREKRLNGNLLHITPKTRESVRLLSNQQLCFLEIICNFHKVMQLHSSSWSNLAPASRTTFGGGADRRSSLSRSPDSCIRSAELKSASL